MSDLNAIFHAYDVRGTYPDQIDADVVERIGAAFAHYVSDVDPGTRRVLIARDMRASGVELSAAFARGVQRQGLNVVDLGLASTDLLYFAAGHLDAPGAMFTASHNPARYNGIKFCRSGARPVGEATGLDRIRHDAARELATAPSEAGSITSRDLLEDFAGHVRSFLRDPAAIKPLKIVADTANGMGGLIVPAVFDPLPVTVEILYPELDGSFPNHPADPIQPENQADLRRRVVETGADLGLAFDGDADRVFVVDEKGEPMSGSTTTSLVASMMLEREPGATILHNLICSRSVPELIVEGGGTPVRTRVGHSFVKAVMAETGAIFGGEHSAHYYFRDNYRADSGIIAAMHVLDYVSAHDAPLSELRKRFERYAASGEINTTVDDTAAVIDKVARHYDGRPQDRMDGLTVDCGEWWFNLRPSNTEPLLRLNLEAPTSDEVARHVAEVRAVFTGA
ncbi:MAG: phosphomannomutase/phosphoglucomutase [Actinobacteria bacterium]|nr:phosphomannomutase/phosphoglucomutase [Actinomycetota bacterium]